MSIPKITKLLIKNFGCIGPEGVEVDIDKIVVLVGANNSGKSTILRAFEVVTEGQKLTQDDFHNRQIVPGALPEIELHSIVTDDNKPGEEWCAVAPNGTWLVKERWSWAGANIDPVRIGYNVDLGRWAEPTDKEKMPWGMKSLSNSRRPKPHRVNTFDSPEAQSKAITSLLKSLLEEDIKRIKSNEEDECSRYDSIVASLKTLRQDSKNIQAAGIASMQTQANLILEQIFPGYQMKVISPESVAPINIDLLGEEFALEMGAKNGASFPLEKQGSGTQRTALWTILKLLADKGIKARAVGGKAKLHHEPLGANISHILLIDEPEVSLHPRATQAARDVLYSLPDSENWQVMLTTHSPSFIDLTKDHTTIIRAEKDHDHKVSATTLYRPDSVQLDEDDKENLKLMNLFDSHISEAFFGGKVLVVEGDTEYTAFNYIRDREVRSGSLRYKDINIIRARGKVTVASMMKVLNHFKTKYYVLHDTDQQKTKSRSLDKKASIDGKKVYKEIEIANPAWTNNTKILQQMSEYSRVVASIGNFEAAYFSEIIESDKPENSINNIKTNAEHYNVVKQLLDSILGFDDAVLPSGSIAWKSMVDIDQAVNNWRDSITIVN
ncbi:AAA family ATPase [Pseudomonas mendocina]|uniref:ATP-dependent nuclease n=1 Tax=Ectopseudomonas mendocina TaxID=300 RepID=UPI0023DC8705|nr:AAA family ATPase [Pseudomonas mendocina]MDF2077076.1 AAA family ATPase [Pseudomonas mendocina]